MQGQSKPKLLHIISYMDSWQGTWTRLAARENINFDREYEFMYP
jgi:hypothetical protein